MASNYLFRSRLAWTGIALLLAGFGLNVLSGPVDLPVWIVPIGYFTALVGAAVLFIGWIRWRAR